MRVQLLYFPDCPHHPDARQALRRCIATLGLSVQFEDVDVSAPGVPNELRGWGSPTILVDGIDVAGLSREQRAPSCRLYGRFGVPTDEQITELLAKKLHR